MSWQNVILVTKLARRPTLKDSGPIAKITAFCDLSFVDLFLPPSFKPTKSVSVTVRLRNNRLPKVLLHLRKAFFHQPLSPFVCQHDHLKTYQQIAMKFTWLESLI